MIETPEQLASILRREEDAAESHYDQLRELQEVAFQYYEAQPLGTEVQGRSQIVLPDVQEAIDYMLPSLLRTFASGDRVVEFEAANEGDEQAADDATAAIDYHFMRKQDGYGVLNDWLNDGLLRKIGIVKAVADKREKVKRTRETVPLEALGMVPDSVEVEVLSDNGDGTVTVELREVRIETAYTGLAIPTHEFRFSPNARHEDTANYLAHVSPKTRGELVEMGFDREQVYDLPRHNDDYDDYESDTLDHVDEEESSEALQLVELREEYARIDVDGDGIAERVKVFRVENTILRWQGDPAIDEFGEPVLDDSGQPVMQPGELAIEVVDEQPFSVFCPFPRPHRLVGYSLADKVMDIQYLRTMIARQMIDGMAFTNLPRPIVAMDQTVDATLDDILSPIPGSPIRVRTAGAVVPMPTNFNVGQSLNVLEWATGERESRTGITRLNQGLDADTLNKTATGTALMQAQGQQMEEYIARQGAEAFARLMMKIYRLMREDGEPFSIQVDGQFRTVEPGTWPEDMNVRVRVGLGTNSKDKRIQSRMAMYGPLTAAIQEGMAGQEHAFKWMDGLARDTGIGQGEDFMYNPADPERAAMPEAPDPEMVRAQEEMTLKREQATFDAEMRLLELQTRMELEAAKVTGQLDLAAFKAQTEAALAQMKARFEAQNKVNMQDQRMGGSLAS